MQAIVRRVVWSFVAMTCVIVSWGSISVFGQASTGTILGVVNDTTDAVIPGVTITIQNVATGFRRTAITAEDGSYRAPALPVGNYTVRFELTGFQTQTRQGLVLTVSQEMVVNGTLSAGAVVEELTVTAEAPLVNTSNAQLGGLVNEQQIAELPLDGRNYIDLALLQPGVTRLAILNPTNVSRGTAFSVHGAPIRSNSFLLDGAPLQDMGGFNATSVADTQLGMDGIQEFKLVTSNFGAEYGQVMGSQMVMVSKSGSNQFHGSAFEYLRNAALDARNFFDYSYQTTGRRVPQYQRNQFGGSLGGPIKTNKTFFFGVYEGLREKKGFPFIDVTIGPGCRGPAGTVLTNADCPQLQLPAGTPSVTISPVAAKVLPVYPLPNLPGNAYSYTYVQPVNVDYGQGRVDHTFSEDDALFGRYTIDSGKRVSKAGGFGQFIEPSTSRNQYLTLSENHIFSPTLLNTARLTYSRTKASSGLFIPTDPKAGDPNLAFQPDSAQRGVPPMIGQLSIQGGISTLGIGTTGGPFSYMAQNLYTASDDIFITKGRHALKTGALVVRYEQATGSIFQIAGSATFGSLRNFMTNLLTSYTVSTPGFNNNRFYRYLTAGGYIQDDWRASARLTVNLGLRYEFRTTPVEASGNQYSLRNHFTDVEPTKGPEFRNASFKNISPRIGFASDVTGNGRTSLRGGFGLYYDVAGLGGLFRQQSRGMPPMGGTRQAVNLPLTFPFVFPAGIAPARNFIQNDYYMGQPYLMQWNLSVERQLPGTMAFTAAYVGTRGVNIHATQQGNPCVPTLIDEKGPYWDRPCGRGRINPNWGTISLNTNQGGFTRYKGLELVLNKRSARGLTFQGSYTLSRNEDVGNGQWPVDRSASRFYVGLDGDTSYNKGVADFDVTHSARISALYHFPNRSSNGLLGKLINGWWMGNIFAIQSGLPFTPVTSGGNRSRSSDTSSTDILDRAPNYNAEKVILGNIDRWFDPSMFQLQPLGRLGSAGRNTLRGPGFFNWDFSLNKDWQLPMLGEADKLQFRTEVFNILNHPNFGLPTTGTYSATGALNQNAGRITSLSRMATPRDIQLSLRLIF